MHIKTDHALGRLGRLLDPDGPWVRIAILSQTEMAALTKAAAILERLRDTWGGQDGEDGEDGKYEHEFYTDCAMAMYTIRELVEAGGVEL